MWYVLTDKAVHRGLTAKRAIRASGLGLMESDFRQVGRDYLAVCRDLEAQEVLRDVRRIDNAVLDKLFRPDVLALPNLLQLLSLVALVILLIRS